ncbi:MAG: hypothetical protein AAF705_03585 [Bacteroidota bacterium]
MGRLELNPASVRKITVFDEAIEEHLPKVLDAAQVDAFIKVINRMYPPYQLPHLKFLVELQDGTVSTYLASGSQVNFEGRTYQSYDYGVFEPSYPFVKIAGYRKPIDQRFILMEMKFINPAKRWMEIHAIFENDYQCTLEGIIQADRAFHHFIDGLFEAATQTTIDKATAYTFVKELFKKFNAIFDANLIQRGELLVDEIYDYTHSVLLEIGVITFEDDFNHETYEWRDHW